jgi:polygalacturonase
MKIYGLTGVVMAAVLTAAIAHAQDTRVVTEPVIPPSCVVLKAQMQADHGVFANGDADEAKLDTARIQTAMDKCDKGKAVELATAGANNAFLAGPLQLRTGVILLVDKGVTLYASRDAHVFETSPDSCAKVNNERNGCHPFITAVNANDSGIMGDGTIDARGGSKVLGKNMSWWDIAATSAGGTTPQQVPQLLTTNHADNFTLYRITLKNAPHFHFVPGNSNGITVWGLKIDTPDHTPNTDGFDPGGGTKNITVIYSYVRDGDDDIVLKGGTGGVANMSVLHSHIYSGHGMSIGGETYGGISHLLVRDLSLDGTANGIRIKSNPTSGGLVDDVKYEDVCIRNSRVPIILTTSYAWPGGQAGEIPIFQHIVLRNVRVEGGGKIQIDGLDTAHRIGVQFDGVELLDGSSQYKTTVKHADVMLGPGPVNLELAGEDATVQGKPGKGKLDGCKDKFVPFPVTP